MGDSKSFINYSISKIFLIRCHLIERNKKIHFPKTTLIKRAVVTALKTQSNHKPNAINCITNTFPGDLLARKPVPLPSRPSQTS